MRIVMIVVVLITFISCDLTSESQTKVDISTLLQKDSVLTIIRNNADSDYIEIKFYPDLQIHELTEFSNGNKNGKNIVWRPNGNMCLESYYENNEMNRIVREVRSNGHTGFEGERINAKFEGVMNDFYESGAIRKRWQRQNGADMGMVIHYHENGLLKEVGENTATGYKVIRTYTDTVLPTTYVK